MAGQRGQAQAQGQRPAQAQRPAQDPRVIGQVFDAKSFFEQQAAEAAQREESRAPETQPADAAARPQGADAVARREAQINRAANSGSNGSLFVGDKGFITTGTYGENTRLLPVERMRDYKFPPELLTRSPGHYRDWIRACKGGEPACSNFSVAVPFVEWMLLGVIAMQYEGKLDWDASKTRFTNNNAANNHLKPHFRKGWRFV